MKSTMIGNKIILEFELGEYSKKLVDLISMIEIANKSKATDEDIDKLDTEIKSNWWERNKDRLLNEDRG
jgi:hypothetical protein